MTGVALLASFTIAIVFMIFLIARAKVHPFIAIMLVALLLAFISGVSLNSIPKIIGEGFSGIFKGIGLVIIFGALIGMILERTGAAFSIANIIIKLVKDRHPEFAMLVMGWVVGIPVFCDSGFVVLDSIRRALIKKIATANPVGMSVALSGGLYASHVFIPPTPGPIAAAGMLGVSSNLFLVIVMGVVVSIPVLISVYLYARFIGKQVKLNDDDFDDTSKTYEQIMGEYKVLPSAFLSLAPILAPIFFMALGSFVSITKMSGDIVNLLLFLGNPTIALGIGLAFAVLLLAKTKKLDDFSEITNDTLKMVGPILFITAAGGVLGKVITAAGFVDFMKENAHIISSAGIFFPFIISAILKSAQGSSTVAIVTTASIMGLYSAGDSMMTALGLTTQIAAVLSVMAIGAGAMCVSHANDSYFWVVTNFSKMTPQQGYKTQTVMTLIMGIVGMLSVYVCAVILL